MIYNPALSQLVSAFHFFFKQQYQKKGVDEISIENFEKSMKSTHGKIIFPNTSWESAKVIYSARVFFYLILFMIEFHQPKFIRSETRKNRQRYDRRSGEMGGGVL